MGIQNSEIFPIDVYDIAYLKDSYLEYHIRAIATEKGLKTLLKIIKK